MTDDDGCLYLRPLCSLAGALQSLAMRPSPPHRRHTVFGSALQSFPVEPWLGEPRDVDGARPAPLVPFGPGEPLAFGLKNFLP
eukprot:2699530-Pyramimonas_sp.AAC.1